MSSAPFDLSSSVVRAGAGAGKTRGLVDTIVSLHKKHRGAQLPRVVLTTFTRKATQELKERLILRACDDRDAELLQFVSDPSHLQISTIHGLLNIFLQNVGHLAGMDSGYRIIGEHDGEQMARMALRETLLASPAALLWIERYGFDRVLAMCRALDRLWREQGTLRPGSIDEIKAASEREVAAWRKTLARLADSVEEASRDEKWQGYAAALRDFAASWSGAGSDDMPSKPRRSKNQSDGESLHVQVEEQIAEFKEKMKNPCWEAERWPQMASEWAAFATFGEAFIAQLAALKEQQGRYEMIDLELKSREILRSHPFLASVFSENWDYWMIDEYQDTSPLQVAILQALCADKPKYIVGDPQQSIYLFRGAEVGVFAEAESAVRAAGGGAIQLMKNFRSQPSLLCWLNDFMTSLNPAFTRMEPREAKDGKPQDCVTLWRAPDAAAELKGLVTRVGELIAQGERLDDICILGRTHRNLLAAARVFKEYGFPTHVHAARGFASRREVIDASALWKFLLNPHDNLNLMVLLRSPWYFVEDWQLAEWMKDKPQSLWRRVAQLTDAPEAIGRLGSRLNQASNDGILRTFESALEGDGFLDFSLANDPAGRKESNLWKLIHKARTLEKEGGQSVLDLLASDSENPLHSTEGDATSAQEPNCINLMTIHGAKGLEFKHVILPCMGETPRTSNTPELAAGAGYFHFPVWDESEGGFISSPLDVLSRQRQRERELEEYDRWLYVALTRAKQTLTLSWCERAGESWVARSSWFSGAKGRTVAAEYIYNVVEEFAEPQMYTGRVQGKEEVRPVYLAASEATAKSSTSVTDLVGSDVRGDLLKRWQAQTLGTSMHRAFEALKYRHKDSVELDPATRFVLELEQPPMRALIDSGNVEWGFQVQTAQGKLEGQIDLWAKHQGRLFVIDYKSGSTAFKEAAFKQLSLYAWALRKFGHREPVEMVVIYPRHKKVESRPFSEELFLNWELELGGP